MNLDKEGERSLYNENNKKTRSSLAQVPAAVRYHIARRRLGDSTHPTAPSLGRVRNSSRAYLTQEHDSGGVSSSCVRSEGRGARGRFTTPGVHALTFDVARFVRNTRSRLQDDEHLPARHPRQAVVSVHLVQVVRQHGGDEISRRKLRRHRVPRPAVATRVDVHEQLGGDARAELARAQAAVRALVEAAGDRLRARA